MEKPNYPHCRMKMETNHDANQEKTCKKSLEYKKNVGRFSRLTQEELSRIARKGGQARSERKRLSSQLNPIKSGNATSVFNIAKCDDCLIKVDCDFYRQGSACQVEINIRRNIIRQFKAFQGDNPKDMLIEIMRVYKKLEQMVEEDKSFYKYTQLFHMLLHLYRMKFCEGHFDKKILEDGLNISLEVKRIMKELRGSAKK